MDNNHLLELAIYVAPTIKNIDEDNASSRAKVDDIPL
jgi:hypothetical protein